MYLKFNLIIIKKPIIFTWFRILIIPKIVFLIYASNFYEKKFFSNYVLLYIYYILSSITDFLDGSISRKFKRNSEFGEFLDPIADKLIIVILLILLLDLGKIDIFICFTLIFREIIIYSLRSWVSRKDFIIRLNVIKISKLKTFLQMFSITILLYNQIIFNLNCHIFGIILMILSIVISLLSMYHYLSRVFIVLKKYDYIK